MDAEGAAMRARLRALALALAALLLFYGLAFSDSSSRTEDTRPLSSEPGAAGYTALRDWFAGSGVRLLALRDDYRSLDRLTGDHPTGNLLIITLPGKQSLLDRDLVPLHQWVRRGNSLLVLAALCDSPEWAPASRSRSLSADVAMLSGVESPRQPEVAMRFLSSPAVAAWRPVAAHPLLRGVGSVESLSDRSMPPCEVTPPPSRGALPLLRAAQGGSDGAWLLPRGDGWVLLVAQATPFANRALGRADNARFAGNILRELVAPSGVVIFDDGLQGVPEPYDLGRLLADPRLHVSALALFALWLAWIVGGTRLRSPAPAPHPPGAAALVAAEARLLARAVEPREAARAALDAFVARLPEGARPAPEAWFATRPGVSAADVAQFGAFRRRLADGGGVPLDPFHDLLTRLRSAIP
jgi:hypothetical protein